MRRFALALIAALAPAAALAATLAVPINHTIRVSLRTPAGDVVVGNPAIADVSVADDHHLLITGKAFGVTNLLVTDAGGRLLMSSEVTVDKPQVGRVTMISGADTLTYACTPECQKVGDQSILDSGLKAGVEAGAAGAVRNAITPPTPQGGDVPPVAPSPGTP